MASSKVFLQSFILIAVCITSLQGMGDVKNIYTSVSNMMGTIKSVKNHYSQLCKCNLSRTGSTGTPPWFVDIQRIKGKLEILKAVHQRALQYRNLLKIVYDNEKLRKTSRPNSLSSNLKTLEGWLSWTYSELEQHISNNTATPTPRTAKQVNNTWKYVFNSNSQSRREVQKMRSFYLLNGGRASKVDHATNSFVIMRALETATKNMRAGLKIIVEANNKTMTQKPDWSKNKAFSNSNGTTHIHNFKSKNGTLHGR